ncbi:helix-turn-helix domain-containing protein [Chloroflexota bacterium]
MEFGKSLRELRKRAGLTQRDLADKVNISHTYLSKIESGAMPPPSKGILFKLADALSIDRDELLILARKIPSDIVEILTDKKILNKLRSLQNKNKTKAVINDEGIKVMKSLVNFRQVAKVALASIMVVAVATSLWFAAPTPSLQAMDFTYTPSQPSVNHGGTMSFTVRVNVTDDDLLPITKVDLQFGDAVLPQTYGETFQDLPIPSLPNTTMPTTTITGTSNTISVTATSGPGWGYGSPGSRTGYGYGYNSSTAWLGWGYHSFDGVKGYGYGKSPWDEPTWVEYNVSWTAPSDWPTGTYYIITQAWGDTDDSILGSTSFTLSSASAGGAALDPGVTTVANYVTTDGVFTRDVVAESADDLVSLTIEEGTTGLTAAGNPLRQIRILEITEADLPPPPEGGHVIGLTYDFGPDGATFDEPISITFTYDPDDLPEGVNEEDLVVAVWDDDADPPQWVELPGVVDTETNTITATVDHFTAFAVIVPPVEEEEVVAPPVEDDVVAPPVEDDVVAPPVEEEEEEEVVAPPVEEEEEVVTPVAKAGLAWWVWLIIGLGSATIVGLLVYFLWYKPQRQSGYRRTD